MLNEPTGDAMDPQEEIVRRYADRLKQEACVGGGTARYENARRCYQLLNDCAMELADLDRPRPLHAGDQSPN